MRAIFMFGPAHGKEMQVADNAPERLMIASPEDRIEFLRQHNPFHGPPEPMVPSLSSKLGMHYYLRHDVFSDDMEGIDCALYLHDLTCTCDREKSGKTESEADKERNRIDDVLTYGRRREIWQ